MEINKITKILPDTFVGFERLRTLTFKDCNLRIIESNIFNGLNNLRELDLSYNKIEILQKDAFYGLSNLKNLNLSLNKLCLDENIYNNVEKGIFNGLNNLEHLNLSHNKIILDPRLFIGLEKLESLLLYRCGIEFEKIKPNSFTPLINLRNLNLDNFYFPYSGPLIKIFNNSQINTDFNTIEKIDENTFKDLGLSNINDLTLPNNYIFGSCFDVALNKEYLIKLLKSNGLNSIYKINISSFYSNCQDYHRAYYNPEYQKVCRLFLEKLNLFPSSIIEKCIDLYIMSKKINIKNKENSLIILLKNIIRDFYKILFIRNKNSRKINDDSAIFDTILNNINNLINIKNRTIKINKEINEPSNIKKIILKNGNLYNLSQSKLHKLIKESSSVIISFNNNDTIMIPSISIENMKLIEKYIDNVDYFKNKEFNLKNLIDLLNTAYYLKITNLEKILFFKIVKEYNINDILKNEY